jgi:glucose/arabinose dehydrogenase
VSSSVEYPYSADKARWSDEKGTRVKDSRDAIKILEDTDGDGKADKVTDFADGLNIPTGVLPWHKPEHKAGCIAWSIPNIWYFADTDGDDKADVREVLFGPLGYEKDTHGMCSSFRLGLDGWVYATHGFNNTSHFKAKDGSTLDLHSGNVFRFKPDGSRVEPWTHGQVNPFGLAWDRYGNLYSADCHSSPIYQLIRGACYPSFGKPHDGLGFAPVMCEHSHGSTGICGIVYIDGGVWGPEWDDHTFVGNCVTSRVNHDKVTFTGSTPKANEQPDFLTSDDPWFRPVDLQLGPDNALYIADFYNKIIGHYEVPLDHPGRDKERGRIWRVVKKGVQKEFNAAAVRVDELVTELGSDNLTRRSLVVQEIFSRYRMGTPQDFPDALSKAKLSAAQQVFAGWVVERINQIAGASIELSSDAKDELAVAHWAHRWASKPVVDGKWPLMWLGESLIREDGRIDKPRASLAVVEAMSVFSGELAKDAAFLLTTFHQQVADGDLTLQHATVVGVKRLLLRTETFESANRDWEQIPDDELKTSPEWQKSLMLWQQVALSIHSEPAAIWLAVIVPVAIWLAVMVLV